MTALIERNEAVTVEVQLSQIVMRFGIGNKGTEALDRIDWATPDQKMIAVRNHRVMTASIVGWAEL